MLLCAALALCVAADSTAALAQPTNLSEAIACLRSPAAADRSLAAAGEVGPLLGSLCARESSARAPSTTFLQLPDTNAGRSAAGYVSWQRARDTTGATPPARRGMAVALEGAGASGERMWLYGGCDVTQPLAECSSDTHALGLDTKAWSSYGSLRSASVAGGRSGASATAWGRQLLIFGGVRDGAPTNDLLAFDTAALTWSRPPVATGVRPRERTSHAAAAPATGGQLWVFGGSSDSETFGDLWLLEGALEGPLRWRQPPTTGETPPPRKGHAMVMLDERLFVWGGSAAGVSRDERLWVLELRTMRWSATSGDGLRAPPHPREGHVMIAVQQRLVLTGGCDFGARVCFGEVDFFDPVLQRWERPEQVGTAAAARHGSVAVARGAQMMLYGGCDLGSRHCSNELHEISCHFGAAAPGGCYRDCSGKGLCVRGLCACAPGWGGSGCDELLLTCANNCSSHGLCVHGQCRCEPGFVGEACENEKRCEAECSRHGVCLHGRCYCDKGFAGDACDLPLDCQANCSHHGICYRGQCHCEPGRKGDTCELTYECEGGCGGRGECVEGVCQCEPGWSGGTCQTPALCAANCSGMGVCAHGRCWCGPGFSGEACETRVGTRKKDCSAQGVCLESSCVCRAGFAGDDCSHQVATLRCPNECTDALHGVCREGRCLCFPGYSGGDCAVAATCVDGCNGHGLCVNGECLCEHGYGGDSSPPKAAPAPTLAPAATASAAPAPASARRAGQAPTARFRLGVPTGAQVRASATTAAASASPASPAKTARRSSAASREGSSARDTASARMDAAIATRDMRAAAAR